MPREGLIQYRQFEAAAPLEGEAKSETRLHIEGYAADYEPYVLYTEGKKQIKEVFQRGCFDGCDMSNVIFRYDHAGKVLACTSNGSLSVRPDARGLAFDADLSRSAAAVELYSEIAAGLITKMSWAFQLGEYRFDRASNTIIHKSVAKIYDVSAVGIPANDNSTVYARSFAESLLKAERLKAQENYKKRLMLKLKLGGL